MLGLERLKDRLGKAIFLIKKEGNFL